jgi:hypothetical protein
MRKTNKKTLEEIYTRKKSEKVLMMRTLTADEYATYHYTKALAFVCTEIFSPSRF